MDILDFKKNRIQVINLETLRRTSNEKTAEGKPVKGMYHYQVIERSQELCSRFNLNFELEEIFAVRDSNGSHLGVSTIQDIEIIHGEQAVEATILRKVFTTIRIDDHQTDELTTTLAIAYHQNGIQMAIGPNVKICHNQCILGADRIASTYGKGKVDLENLFAFLTKMLKSHYYTLKEDRKLIERMQKRVLSPEEVVWTIGNLTSIRVAHDSKDKRLSKQVEIFPMNQSQITVFTERLLKRQLEASRITLWDMYNEATEVYKPDHTEVPGLINQNFAFVQFAQKYLPF